MSPRVEAFRSFAVCPIRKAIFQQLTKDEKMTCEAIIWAYDRLPYGEFNAKINRWLLDEPAEKRPPHYFSMVNLLMEANAVTRPPRRKQK